MTQIDTTDTGVVLITWSENMVQTDLLNDAIDIEILVRISGKKEILPVNFSLKWESATTTEITIHFLSTDDA